jgi:hypothetical protein
VSCLKGLEIGIWMSRFKVACVEIQGTRPLFWHAFSVDALSKDRKEKTGSAGNDPEEWKRSVLITENRQLYLPDTYVFGCICNGAKYLKVGKGSLQPKVAATVQVLTEKALVDRFLPLNEELSTQSDALVYLDIRGVKNPSTKGRNVRYRVAASKGWNCSFDVTWDSSIVSVNELVSILNDAGSFVGLGDGRSIGFGRFKVSGFKVEDHSS